MFAEATSARTASVFVARQLLLEAYARVAREGLTVTDEVSAIQILGVKVAIVPAQKANLKLTVAGDLEIAECLLRHPERSLGDPDAGTLR